MTSIVHRGRDISRLEALSDGWITFYNSTLLLVVLFYVYPLKFVTQGLLYGIFGVGSASVAFVSWQDLALLFVLYGAGFIAIFSAWR